MATRWRCRCDCGNVRDVRAEDLKSGNSKSCGCIQREKARARFLTHGKSKTKLYSVWCQMKRRCINPNDGKFADYGARGITVCERWRESFEAFERDMGPRPKGFTLDRIDNDGNYEPNNCRWAKPATQSRNNRKNIWVEHEGRRMVAADFAAIMGVTSKSLYKVMSRDGLSPHDAVDYIKANRRRKSDQSAITSSPRPPLSGE